jgi:alpha-galactosidase
LNSLASLMLGGNGIWGDLLSLSEADLTLLAGHLADYKRVAAGVTRAYPRVRGFTGSSPEVYEKIDPASATVAVIFFTVTPGRITHLTQPLARQPIHEITGADAWEQTGDGRLWITVDLGANDARIVFVQGTVG